MRIGINLLAFLPEVSGGSEFYIRNLLVSLAENDRENDYYLFTNLDNDRSFDLHHPNFHRIRMNIHAHPQLGRVFCEQMYLPLAAFRLSLDVLHSPSYTWPVFSTVPGVVTINDMLYRSFPRYIEKTKLAFWRLFVPLSAKRCRKILTISEYSKQEIVNYLRVSSHKVVVTPLALDLELPGIATKPSEQQIGQTCRKHGIPQPYVLSVGGVGMHKNPIALLKALKVLRSRPRAGNLTLVIVGRDYGARAEIESRASSLGIRDSVHLPGYVPRQDLPALYAGSLVYVSPSYFEGFGLTVLEAMAFKCPVVVSNRTALPEVAGHAALIVDPDDTESLADAILLAAFDPEYRTRMIEAGTRRIKDFSWDRAARLTLTAYEEAAAGYA